jgi:hypothetical protein
MENAIILTIGDTMKPLYTQILSREERAQAINTGMVTKTASVATKEASIGSILGSLADLGTKGIVVGSLVTGIPLGIMAHIMHNKVKQVRQKEKDMDAQIDYYNQAAGSIESTLADEMKAKETLDNPYKYV